MTTNPSSNTTKTNNLDLLQISIICCWFLLHCSSLITSNKRLPDQTKCSFFFHHLNSNPPSFESSAKLDLLFFPPPQEQTKQNKTQPNEEIFVGANACSMKSLYVRIRAQISETGREAMSLPEFIGSANAGLVVGPPFCLRVMFGYDALFHVSITTRVIRSAYNVCSHVCVIRIT